MKRVYKNPYFWPAVGTLLIFTSIVFTVNQYINLTEVISGFQWNILIIAISMSLFTTILAGTGAMNKIAVKFAEWSSGHVEKILIAYPLLLFLFSAFLNNLTATLVILPALLILLRGVKLSEMYVASLFSLLLAVGNLAGASTPIGDFPALIIMSSGITTFSNYLKLAFPLFFVTALVIISTHIFLFRRYTDRSESKRDQIERIVGVTFLEVQHRYFKIDYINFGVISFIFLVMFISWSTLQASTFPPEVIAMIGITLAGSIAVARGARTDIGSFDLKPFLMIASFLLIAGIVNNTGILVKLSKLLEQYIQNPVLLLFTVMLLTATLTGLISAGPSAAAMMPVIQSLANGPLHADSHWLAIAFACSICAGSSLFFWSATAGFMLSDKVGKANLRDNIAKKHIYWGFRSYLKYGIIHFFIQLAIGIIWVFTGLLLF